MYDVKDYRGRQKFVKMLREGITIFTGVKWNRKLVYIEVNKNEIKVNNDTVRLESKDYSSLFWGRETDSC